jgi:hypothetical protein
VVSFRADGAEHSNGGHFSLCGISRLALIGTSKSSEVPCPQILVVPGHPRNFSAVLGLSFCSLERGKKKKKQNKMKQKNSSPVAGQA